MMFSTKADAVYQLMDKTDPEAYGRTRNFENGAVTHLSPYISRGVISTKAVYNHIMKMDLPWHKVEKLVQELAWRDYWQLVWQAKGVDIDEDLKSPQEDVNHYKIPKAVVEANTGIDAVDEAIASFYKTGYMHNHMRMYVASIACNIGRAHWREPARWLYAHLLDGDWASNALSWQWVAGSNASKKYYANQENINKYFNSNQQETFLDVPYEAFENPVLPEELRATVDFDANTKLPESTLEEIDPTQKTLIYNYYNLDPDWYAEEKANRILLLEPSFFERYPVADKCIRFMLGLSENISNVKIYTGEFAELKNQLPGVEIYYKEHPTTRHYLGVECSRDFLTDIKGYLPSFFAYWKHAKKQLTP